MAFYNLFVEFTWIVESLWGDMEEEEQKGEKDVAWTNESPRPRTKLYMFKLLHHWWETYFYIPYTLFRQLLHL